MNPRFDVKQVEGLEGVFDVKQVEGLEGIFDVEGDEEGATKEAISWHKGSGEEVEHGVEANREVFEQEEVLHSDAESSTAAEDELLMDFDLF